jgi:DNA-binding protein Fis
MIAPPGISTPIDADWPTLDELTLRYVKRVLEHTKGNKAKAATVLGIDRRTINRILAMDHQRMRRADRTAPTAIPTPTDADGPTLDELSLDGPTLDELSLDWPTLHELSLDWPTLDELSLRYVKRVLEHAEGNKAKAAAVLGIDRRTVDRILAMVHY